MTMKSLSLQHNFFLVLLVGVIVLTFFIFLPYLNVLVLAGVFAVLFRPLFWLLKRGVKSEAIAALLTLIIIVAVIATPLYFFGKQIVSEATGLYFSLRDGTGGELLDTLVQKLHLNIDFKLYIQQFLVWLVSHFGVVFSGIAQAIALIFVGLVALYYFLKDGTRIKRALIELSPLANSYDEDIFNRLHAAVNSVIRGSLVIAMIQGVLATLGFAIFGVPNPALWGSVTIIAALIPGIGTSLVLIPAIIYLFATGATGHAIGMLIWGALAVGTIDNFLGPRLVGRRIKIHELLILLSVLGGIALFGPIGFILGPLVLSLLVALLDIYKTLILQEHNV